MTSTHKVPKKITAVFAIIFLIPALYIFILWTSVSDDQTTQSQSISSFLNHFPSFIKDYKVLLYTSVACSLLSMILAAKSFKQPIIALRIAMWLTVIIAALVFLLTVFQLL